jgi:hypothetical protein
VSSDKDDAIVPGAQGFLGRGTQGVYKIAKHFLAVLPAQPPSFLDGGPNQIPKASQKLVARVGVPGVRLGSLGLFLFPKFAVKIQKRTKRVLEVLGSEVRSSA